MSFIYFILDNEMFLLSMRLMDRCPYRYNSSWFLRLFRLFLYKISITLTARFALWVAYRGHSNKKWLVSWLHSRITEGVSAKLWRLLWFLRGLKFTLNWKIYRRPKGSCTPKVLLVLGRIRERICPFKLVKDETFWKILIILFQELIALGKKLFWRSYVLFRKKY